MEAWAKGQHERADSPVLPQGWDLTAVARKQNEDNLDNWVRLGS